MATGTFREGQAKVREVTRLAQAGRRRYKHSSRPPDDGHDPVLDHDHPPSSSPRSLQQRNMATIKILLFLLAGSRITTASHWDSEICSNDTGPMSWEILNLTISGQSNTTYYLNNTVAAPYYIGFSILNSLVTWPQDCEAKVVLPPDGSESDDGDSGWLSCGRSNSPPGPPPIANNEHEVSWKDKVLSLLSLAYGSSKFQVPPGTPGVTHHPLAVARVQTGHGASKFQVPHGSPISIHDPVDGDGRPLAVARVQTGHQSNKFQVPHGSPISIHDPVDGDGKPIAVARVQTPTRPSPSGRRASIQDYGGGMFRFNRSSGELFIMQRWGCYGDNTREWITNFDATGSVTFPDFSCSVEPSSTQGPNVARLLARLPIRANRAILAGSSDIAKDDSDDPSDEVIYDCVPTTQDVRVIPSELEVWAVDANDTCAWNNACMPPGDAVKVNFD